MKTEQVHTECICSDFGNSPGDQTQDCFCAMIFQAFHSAQGRKCRLYLPSILTHPSLRPLRNHNYSVICILCALAIPFPSLGQSGRQINHDRRDDLRVEGQFIRAHQIDGVLRRVNGQFSVVVDEC